MRLYINPKNQIGATLVEVLVAIALTGIMMPALATAVISSSYARPTAVQQLNATALLQEIAVATRSVRESGWGNVSVDGTYHTVISGNGWALASGPNTSNGFTDQVVISDVQRNSSGVIVSSGGTIDPSTKLATINVSWTTPTSSSVSSSLYLTRWQNETDWSQTTQADFTGDTLTNTTVTNVSGGEVQLTGGQTSGTVESSSFDAGAAVGFNYLSFTDSVPTGTNIEFQVASNNDNSTWNFVGPDGTSATYFTSPGAIPLSDVSGRYIRYQATLTTTNASLPVLDDITVTYSP
jgi:hypothetical protein